MPELPEVETIRRNILSCVGQSFCRVIFRRDDILKRRDFEPEQLEGAVCRAIVRRGKYLRFLFDDERQMTVHLGMSGRLWRSTDEEEQNLRHVHLILALENGEFLLFYDPRRFGGVWLTVGTPMEIQRLGIEPLDVDFNETMQALWEKLRRRTAAVKETILNQRLIAGLGNIYADESLFRAQIHPLRPTNSLTREEWRQLGHCMKDVLEASLQNKGTTFRDYRDGLNRKGAFQDFLQVYGKAGKPCTQCGTALQTVRIAGRSSCFCPCCQQLPQE